MEGWVVSIVLVLAMWFLYEGVVWLRERFRGEDDTSVSLFCPRREERIPIASEKTEPVWSDESTNCLGYRCEECGNIHTWKWGHPAPFYAGDKIRIKIDGSNY